MNKVVLKDAFASFHEHWSPRIVGDVDGCHVKVVKLRGEFTWHRHEHEDELFLVVAGSLRMQFRERTIVLAPGELVIVPRGVEHCPAADEECHVLLFEPKSTLNTGNVVNELTVEAPKRLDPRPGD